MQPVWHKHAMEFILACALAVLIFFTDAMRRQGLEGPAWDVSRWIWFRLPRGGHGSENVRPGQQVGHRLEGPMEQCGYATWHVCPWKMRREDKRSALWVVDGNHQALQRPKSSRPAEPAGLRSSNEKEEQLKGARLRREQRCKTHSDTHALILLSITCRRVWTTLSWSRSWCHTARPALLDRLECIWQADIYRRSGDITFMYHHQLASNFWVWQEMVEELTHFWRAKIMNSLCNGVF